MRLMVTGGAGFIGSAVIRQAIADGHTVLNVDKLTYAANLENLTPIADSPNYEFVEADICDGKKMAELVMGFRPDTIMHLAAESHVDRSIDGPGAFIETNIVGTYQLLAAARGIAWVAVSATDGTGLGELAAAVGRALDRRPAAGSLARELAGRHRVALDRALEALAAAREQLEAGGELDLVAGELRLAVAALDEISGRTSPEDLLDRIFARFCIGK